MMTRRSWPVALALAAGLAWIAGVVLVSTQADSDPVGARYDAYNRVLTLALVLLLASAVVIRHRVAAAGAAGTGPLTAVVAGLALTLAGNVLEFWGALAAAEKPSATAERLGLEDEFWGSLPGFLVFLLGGLVVVVAMIACAISLGASERISPLQRAAVGAGGFLMVASPAFWAVSPVAALVPAVLFALAWVWLAVAATGVRARAPGATTNAPA